MSRRLAREEAFKLLYQYDIQKSSIDMIFEIYYEYEKSDLNENEKSYIEDVVKGAIKYEDEINKLIKENAINWDINRISKVNIAILKIALYEILYREDIPANVSINEAVELAKFYDNKKAGAFINGILGSVKKQLSDRGYE
jgi:N utilization substance protein B